jgi:CRISPR-associated protein Csx10
VTSYRWTVTFESDWGVGSGWDVPAGLDRTIRLDRDGLPYLPGKTTTGLWRDAIEQVVAALAGEAGSDPRAGWVEALLGTQIHDPAGTTWLPRSRPRPAALAIRGAHLREPLAAGLVARGLSGAARGVVTAAKIDDVRGRSVERARAGLTLHSVIEVDTSSWTERQRRYAQAILVVAASLLHHAGAGRRRGAGRCTVRMPDAMPLVEAVTTLRAVEDPPRAAAPAVTGRRSTSDGSVRLALTITCRLPVVATARTFGSIRRGLDYVPGTMLLAAVASRLTRAGLDADAAIRGGRLLATDATPEVAGERGLPVPRCLAIHNGLVGRVDAVNLLREQGAGAAAIRGGYVVPAGSGAALHYRQVEREASTHNVIDDLVQRPTERVGGVYTHETIPAGSVLRGEVRLPAQWQAVAIEALAGRWRIGRASKDEYGLVDVTVQLGRTRPARPAQVPAGGGLVIWLAATALVRDRWLQPVTDARRLRSVLAEVLGVELVDPATGPAAVLWVDRRESWHGGWGLPRTSLVGVGAGSVLRSVAPAGVPAKALARLATDGIGERRAEGFGRVVVNPPVLAEPAITLVPVDEPAGVQRSAGELTDDEQDLLRTLEG